MCPVHFLHLVYLAGSNFFWKNILFLPARSYKAQFGLAIKIYSVWIVIVNKSAIWLVKTKPQNKQMHGRIPPRRACNPCGYTMKISCRYHRLLIYDVKRTTKIDGMGPYNAHY